MALGEGEAPASNQKPEALNAKLDVSKQFYRM